MSMSTSPSPLPEPSAGRSRWNAVVRRDRTADGRFVYAVRTTGVLCRPSCASRLPRRDNVVFFATAEEAIRAGYRPCRRCRPTETDPRVARDRALERACRLLMQQDPVRSLGDVCAEVGLSRYHFQRRFKAVLGVTPEQFRRRIMAERAKRALGRAGSITDAVYAAGYSSSSRFYDTAARELGMSAARARRGAPGETVRYAVRRCSLGRIAVAWTARGVCDVRLGRTESQVVSGLSERFSAAKLVRARAVDWVNEVVEEVEHPGSTSIPLDVRGTAFQERVWQALRAIPPGETRSYAELARQLRVPRAPRAVARACANNALAVVVPCHRVLRSDGGLGGYRWGIQNKRILLEREARIRASGPSR